MGSEMCIRDRLTPDAGDNVPAGAVVIATDGTGARFENTSGGDLPMPNAFPSAGFTPVQVEEGKFVDTTDGMDAENGDLLTLKPTHTVNVDLPKGEWFIYRIIEGDDHSAGNTVIDFGAGSVNPPPTAAVGTYRVVSEGSNCLLYTSPSPRDLSTSRMPSSA